MRIVEGLQARYGFAYFFSEDGPGWENLIPQTLHIKKTTKEILQ